MLKIGHIAMMVAAASLAAVGTLAHARDVEGGAAIILSGAAGAMLPPEDWDCDLYVSEYRQFLKDGHPGDHWRFAGKRYRSERTGSLYDWQMWLEWEAVSNCPGLLPVTDMRAGNGFGGMAAVGIVGGLLTTGAIAAGGGGSGGSGSPPKSPG